MQRRWNLKEKLPSEVSMEMKRLYSPSVYWNKSGMNDWDF
jgi:hypothetical protein